MVRPATGSTVPTPLRGATALSLALLLVLANVQPARATGATDGFVTGGGWIPSPAGAYTADPALTGRGTFGLVAKHAASGAAKRSQFVSPNLALPESFTETFPLFTFSAPPIIVPCLAVIEILFSVTLVMGESGRP